VSDELKRRDVVLSAALAASALLSVTPASASGLGQSSPAATLRTEMRLIHLGDFRSYYELFSPTFRATCPLAAFLRFDRGVQQRFSGLSLRILAVRIDGSKASLTYEFLHDGVAVGKLTGDVYVKVDGKWYDEVDKYTRCPTATTRA
jgi:hypothetical protein